MMDSRVVAIKEASEKWVDTFHPFPTDMIKILIDASYDELYSDNWENVTPLLVGQEVFVGDEDSIADFADGCIEPNGEITEYDEETDLYTIKLNDGKTVKLKREEFGICYNDMCYHLIPMWGTMWKFNEVDKIWLKYGGLRKMAECGFTIIHSEKFGYFFGINSGGYNFYMVDDKHPGPWVKLYLARNGLSLPTEEENDSEEKTE